MTAFLVKPESLFAPVAALLTGVALLMLGNGLFLTLVPLRASSEGFSAAWIGAIGASYFAGFALGCFVLPPLVARVGHIRAFAAVAALAAIAPLLHALVLTPSAWVAFRAVLGFCLSGLYMVIESWLNGASKRSNRSTVFSGYIAVHLSALTAGQFLILLGSPAGPELFSLAAILFALAVVPVSLTHAASPPMPVSVAPSVRKLWRNSQVAVAGCLTNGMVNGAIWSLAPVYATSLDLALTGIAVFVSVAILGGAFVQYPLGRLSDRLPERRWLVAILCIVAAGAALVLVFGTALPLAAAYLAYFLFGAAAFSVYGICVAHANDHAESENFVEISAGLLMIFAFGAVIGPLIASALMETLGPGYLFLFTGTVHGAVGLWTAWRIKRGSAEAPEDRASYVPTIRTSPNAFALDPRAETAEHDEAGTGPRGFSHS